MLDVLIAIDRSIFLFFNSTLANPVFDLFFPFITRRSNLIIPGILAAIFFVYKKKKEALVVIGLLAITAAIADPLCVRVLKPFFNRLRPCNPSYFVEGKHIFLAGGNFLLGHKRSLAFPSAHAVNMFASATLLTLLYPKKAAWFFTLCTLVAFSRIMVGVHYPFDFVAGAILGSGIGACVFYMYNYSKQKIAAKRADNLSEMTH